MNPKKQNPAPVKGIQHILRIVLLAWMLTGCSFFGEQAPLSDGLYLNYDFAGSVIRVTFSEIDANKFYATR